MDPSAVQMCECAHIYEINNHMISERVIFAVLYEVSVVLAVLHFSCKGLFLTFACHPDAAAPDVSRLLLVSLQERPVFR